MSRSSWARTNSAQSAGEPRAGAITGGSIDSPPMRGDLPDRLGRNSNVGNMSWSSARYPVPKI